MDKIITQDCYLPTKVENNEWKGWLFVYFNGDDKIIPVEKHTNMVVLTVEQLNAIRKKDIEDAFTAGMAKALLSQRMGKTEYINSILP